MYKKLLLSVVMIFGLLAQVNGAGFSKEATTEPILVQDGKSKHWCPVCGMSIKKFYKTSHTSTLENGKKRQYCSIRCVAVDKQEYKIDKSTIKVIDAKTENLIDSVTAYYVIGSKAKGTMTKVSKFAFANKVDAQAFIKKFGGKLSTFDDTMNLAEKSLETDIAMVNKKKRMKVYPMGKKIFKTMCNQDIDPTKYIEINDLKADIKHNKLCKRSKGRDIKENQLQVVSIYLWEVKRFGDGKLNSQRVQVKKDEKCPVCGMFTYKYPRWAAQIFYANDKHKHHFSFDGVKDMMKFYFDANKWGNYPIAKKENITKILVTDYYTQKAIDGTKAFYVVRSDIYGPMGHELIPFASLSNAKVFKHDHLAKQIIEFKDIIESEVYKLDENE